MFKKNMRTLKRRLSTAGSDEPLNKLSMAIIILLDLFVLHLLFVGLGEHRQQLTSVNEYMPYSIRQAFTDQSWGESTRLDKLQTMVLSDHDSISYRHNSIFEPNRIQRMHPLCRDIYARIRTLSEDEALVEQFVTRRTLIKEQSKLVQRGNKSKAAYDTHLLETIADSSTKKSKRTALQHESKSVANHLDHFTADLASLEHQIQQNRDVQSLWAILNTATGNRQIIIEDYQRFERWFPARELGWELLFMLTIFAVMYAWCVRSARKDHRIRTLISSHMLLIASLPILIKIFTVVVDLIPHHFFKNLFDFLESIHLVAIWHYLAIAGSIGVGIFLVFFIQKKVFNHTNVIQKRLVKGTCIACSKKLPQGASACPICGKKQMHTCTACEKQTPIAGAYCMQCGEKSAPLVEDSH